MVRGADVTLTAPELPAVKLPTVVLVAPEIFKAAELLVITAPVTDVAPELPSVRVAEPLAVALPLTVVVPKFESDTAPPLAAMLPVEIFALLKVTVPAPLAPMLLAERLEFENVTFPAPLAVRLP